MSKDIGDARLLNPKSRLTFRSEDDIALECAGYAAYFIGHSIFGIYSATTGQSLFDSLIQYSTVSATAISMFASERKMEKGYYGGLEDALVEGIETGSKTFLLLEATALAGYLVGVGIGVLADAAGKWGAENYIGSL